ncbi:MAG: hypothetical protein GX154_11140 [Clostridiales bacterium]|nr:hypothetical protein [Clostridiales bacterium]
MKFEIVFGNERLITPTGLALAGLLLKKTDLRKRLNVEKFKNQHGLRHVCDFFERRRLWLGVDVVSSRIQGNIKYKL